MKVNDCGEGSRDIGRSRHSFLLILGAILDAFRKHFGYLAGVLDDTGASLSLLGIPGDPWELQGSIFIGVGIHFGGPWEVSFHVFSA